MNLKNYEAWFITGSQELYGKETLQKVAENSHIIAEALNADVQNPVTIKCKPVATGPEAILNIILEANNTANCVGLITWMHTFSPAKMWIAGLKALNKPILHLHTQFNRDLPWHSIDMDFMNLNQSAHGDREYGFILSRMRMERKVIVGHWEQQSVRHKLAMWLRAACAWNDWQGMKVARFGDNMREVAVTEGDKVEAQLRLGYSVNGYGVGDLVEAIQRIKNEEVDSLLHEYEQTYSLAENLKKGGEKRQSLVEAAKIEAGMLKFLESGGFKAFTTTFEDLHGLGQLPGLAVQRLMAKGYGFGAEGDWKTAALVRAMKVMAAGLPGGTSFMEDYTYHLDPSGMKVLGAHMLEVCPSVSDSKAHMEIHPLGIGGKSDPVRLVFNVPEGKGINVSILDMGARFRMLINPCKVVAPDNALPNLPVARVVWMPEPNLEIAAEAWIHAGGAHHTGFSMALNAEIMEDFAEIAGIESLLIDKNTSISQFKKELRWNDIYYHLAKGI